MSLLPAGPGAEAMVSPAVNPSPLMVSVEEAAPLKEIGDTVMIGLIVIVVSAETPPNGEAALEVLGDVSMAKMLYVASPTVGTVNDALAGALPPLVVVKLVSSCVLSAVPSPLLKYTDTVAPPSKFDAVTASVVPG